MPPPRRCQLPPQPHALGARRRGGPFAAAPAALLAEGPLSRAPLGPGLLENEAQADVPAPRGPTGLLLACPLELHDKHYHPFLPILPFIGQRALAELSTALFSF